MMLFTFDEDGFWLDVAKYVIFLLILIILINTFPTVRFDSYFRFIYPITMADENPQRVNLFLAD